MDESEEFQSVEHAGGTVTFHVRGPPENRELAQEIQHSVPHACSIFAVAMVDAGIVLVASVDIGGMQETATKPPGGSKFIPVYIISDKEGFIGRRCPRCNQYFRTHAHGRLTCCPYCGLRAGSHQFLSDGQKRYAERYVETLLGALESGETVTIDFGTVNAEFAGNSTPSPLAEQRQQTQFTCSACKNRADIVGRFGYCPACGHRNAYSLLTSELDTLVARVDSPRYSPEKRDQREGEWRSIVRDCVSAFEGFARDLLGELLKLPLLPSRRKALTELTFHQPLAAAGVLGEVFGFDLLRGLGEEEQRFVQLRFLRRHVYEHGAGEADAEYIRNSGENVRPGQKIRERSSQVRTLLQLTRTIAENFDRDFNALSGPTATK